MPNYDYRCNACDHRFEKKQRITEAAGAQCPQCADTGCERLITGGTFHLRGSGWYASDYSSKKSEPAADGAGTVAPASSETPATAANGTAATVTNGTSTTAESGAAKCGSGAGAAAAEA
ncbi:MAG: zinc ribbon domain-containing protein [Myxococcales bacterium]|nr:zinc ribbon domain-containing protein [Myxococcales bacterium]